MVDNKTIQYTVTKEFPTFFSIARHLQKEFPGITAEKIMADNGVTDPTKLAPGTRLTITLDEVARAAEAPAVARKEEPTAKATKAIPVGSVTHKVTEALPTFSQIARHYRDQFPGITAEKIMADNGVTDPTKLAPGTRLTITLDEVARAAEAPARKEEPAAVVPKIEEKTAVPRAASVAGQTYDYVVPRGATLSGLASKFKTSAQDIAEDNGLITGGPKFGSDLRSNATLQITPGSGYVHSSSDGLTNPRVITNKIPEAVADRAKEAVRGLDFRPNAGCIVHLTFDDGPHLENTPKVLDSLKGHSQEATFFVNIGVKDIDRDGNGKVDSPKDNAKVGILFRTLDEGHALGNHTISHPDLRKISGKEMRAEIEGCEKAIRMVYEANGKDAPDTIPFRAPFGALNTDIRKYLDSRGTPHVAWGVNSLDFQASKQSNPSAFIESNVFNGTKDPNQDLHSCGVTYKTSSATYLFHDSKKATVDALPGVLDRMKTEGISSAVLPEYQDKSGTEVSQNQARESAQR